MGVLSQQIKHSCPSWSRFLSRGALEDLSVPSLRDQFFRRQMACGLLWSQEIVSHRLKIVLFKLFFFLSETHLLWICPAPTEAFSLLLFPCLGHRGQGGHEPQTGRGVGTGASGWKGDNVWWCWWHWKVALAGGRCLQTDTDPQVSQPVPAPGPLPELPVWMSALSSFPAGCCWEFGCILNQIRLPWFCMKSLKRLQCQVGAHLRSFH